MKLKLIDIARARVDSYLRSIYNNTNLNEQVRSNACQMRTSVDVDYIGKLTIIQLTRDIAEILDYYKYGEKSEIRVESLLSASTFGMVVVPRIGLEVFVENKEMPAFVSFADAEELRRYLYGLVGFEYQSKEDAELLPENEVIDPMALPKYNVPISIDSYISDPSLLEHYRVPRVKEGYTKRIGTKARVTTGAGANN